MSPGMLHPATFAGRAKCCRASEPIISSELTGHKTRRAMIRCRHCGVHAELDFDFDSISNPSGVDPVTAYTDMLTLRWSEAVKRASLTRYGLSP